MSQDDINTLNQIAMQIQFYEGQLQNLQSQLQLLQSTILSLENVSFTIENLDGVEPGQEVLLPIGKIARIRAKVLDPKHVILNVGASVFIEQGSKEASENISVKIEEIKKAQTTIQQNMEQIFKQIEQLRPRFNELYQKIQGSPPPGMSQ
ncbi:MAG: prefoldin subunit alpha [Candidatus Helarchaeota archaeon]